jgi:hypothetical protein
MKAVANVQDVLAIETRGRRPDLPSSTYEMICGGAAINPVAPALSFFATADDHRNPECWTYSELVRDVTRTANMFARLGVQRDSVVAYVLPNLPETHFVIWGGEAAGIVCAINPLLESEAIGELLKASAASVLVTLAPFPGTDLWQKVQAVLHKLPCLEQLVLVNPADRMQGEKGFAAGRFNVASVQNCMVPAAFIVRFLRMLVSTILAPPSRESAGWRSRARVERASTMYRPSSAQAAPRDYPRLRFGGTAMRWPMRGAQVNSSAKALARGRRFFAGCRFSTSTP